MAAAINSLLLDTHAFLWACFAPQRLSNRAREWVTDGGTKVHVSVASLWEIEVKHESGMLQADAKVVDASMRAMGIAPVAITAEHLRRAAQQWGGQRGKDPFDWMIAAQAVTEGWALVSADEGMGRFEGLEVRW